LSEASLERRRVVVKKIATVVFVVIQLAFIACALVVVSESQSQTTLVDVATFLVAYYVLGSSSWRLINVIFCQKTPDKKGVLDL